MIGTPSERVIPVGGGKVLRPTPVFDSYWRFAAARQDVFLRRLSGEPPPWTVDPIIAAHRFTNAYRASDRVSQYLIKHVLYAGVDTAEEIFFRAILFKLFNRIETWELLSERLGDTPNWKHFEIERYGRVLDAAMERGTRLYSGAYIMPSPPFGSPRKHRNHLQLLDRMMRDDAPRKVATAGSLRSVFEILRSYPSLGDFLAFQFTIDLNYSAALKFFEDDFVVAGPGARDGIRKCFRDTDGLTEAEVIARVARIADEEFGRLGLQFKKLGGSRALQLIDCQNLFCETDKYARVAHPEFSAASGRTRIKQKFAPNCDPLPQFYPPRWGINAAFAQTAQPSAALRASPRQVSLPFVAATDGR
jgi:alpha-glutamyl/putrescinyl thymine pyrophosphorylase clade 1